MATHENLAADTALENTFSRAQHFESFPRLVEAVFYPDADLQLLMLRLDDGRRLPIPREELSELNKATDAQAADLKIISQASAIWWPQIDDVFYLPDFLEARRRKAHTRAA